MKPPGQTIAPAPHAPPRLEALGPGGTRGRVSLQPRGSPAPAPDPVQVVGGGWGWSRVARGSASRWGRGGGGGAAAPQNSGTSHRHAPPAASRTGLRCSGGQCTGNGHSGTGDGARVRRGALRGVARTRRGKGGSASGPARAVSRARHFSRGPGGRCAACTTSAEHCRGSVPRTSTRPEGGGGAARGAPVPLGLGAPAGGAHMRSGEPHADVTRGSEGQTRAAGGTGHAVPQPRPLPHVQLHMGTGPHGRDRRYIARAWHGHGAGKGGRPRTRSVAHAALLARTGRTTKREVPPPPQSLAGPSGDAAPARYSPHIRCGGEHPPNLIGRGGDDVRLVGRRRRGRESRAARPTRCRLNAGPASTPGRPPCVLEGKGVCGTTHIGAEGDCGGGGGGGGPGNGARARAFATATRDPTFTTATPDAGSQRCRALRGRWSCPRMARVPLGRQTADECGQQRALRGGEGEGVWHDKRGGGVG